ncbi:MAG: PIN domain-containing protein [Acidobacteriota bacterium]|nr:PIN domain-containing protein [Acidobacteriota bacterium]
MAGPPERGVVALDTNAVHDYYAAAGVRGSKAALIARAFEDDLVVLPPPVLSEVLSDPMTSDKSARIRALPLLEVIDGYWTRAGRLRAAILAQGYRAFLADCLIAQVCIDHDVPLITYDRDFSRFVSAGLKLI